MCGKRITVAVAVEKTIDKLWELYIILRKTVSILFLYEL